MRLGPEQKQRYTIHETKRLKNISSKINFECLVLFTLQQQQKICLNDRPDLHDSDEVELGDETSLFSSELPRQAELGPQQRQLTFCRLQCTAAKTSRPVHKAAPTQILTCGVNLNKQLLLELLIKKQTILIGFLFSICTTTCLCLFEIGDLQCILLCVVSDVTKCIFVYKQVLK